MKYAIGQKVRVRPDLSTEMEIRIPFGVNLDMEKLAGSVVTIHEISETFNGNRCYTIKEDRGNWNWHEDMFVPVDVSVDEAFELVLKGGLTDEQYEVIRRERG